MNNIMTDLETLGTGTKSVIISIGAVAFDETSVSTETFYREISIDSCLNAGLKISGDTIAWWMLQSEEARKVFQRQQNKLSMVQALQQFSEFVESYGNVKMWGNGANFDNRLLCDAYESLGLQTPWKFWNDRCYRTVKSLYKDVEAYIPTGTFHNALDDAENQAKHLIKICQAKGLEL